MEQDQFLGQEEHFGEEPLTVDDLIFMIGEKEADLFRKRKSLSGLVKRINQLQSQNKDLSQKIKEFESLEQELIQKEKFQRLEEQVSEKEQMLLQRFEEEKVQIVDDMKKEYQDRIESQQKEYQEQIKKEKADLQDQHDGTVKRLTRKLEQQRDLATSLSTKLEEFT